MTTRARALFVSASLVAGMLTVVLPARAHPLAFGVLDVEERARGRFDLDFHYSGDEATPAGSMPVLPDGCVLEAPLQKTPLENGIRVRGSFRCRGGLEGRALRVTGLRLGGSEVAVRVRLASGRTHRALVGASHPAFVVPSETREANVIGRYVVLGIEHIALGLDHLLFVLGLFLLVDGTRRRVATITAFTLGHSLTLVLAALSIVHVPAAPTEACIALSIVLVAAQIARGDRESTARTKPWLVASTFGLLHGLGFAGALAEVGLPDDAIPTALFGFNLGVEIGQLAFVLVLLAITGIARAVSSHDRLAFAREEVAPRAIGALATYFLCERIVALVS